MSESNRHGDCLYNLAGEPTFTGCRMSPTQPMPRCAYCGAESTRLCDSAGGRRMGHCGIRLCEAHTTRVGPYHDLCREHAAGDHLEVLRRGETAQNVWWEIVQTRALPIPGTGLPLSVADRIPGVIDPDDELD